ncbi:hypothetical protein KQX54_005116 [Cotesia glomerata]|uniref:BRCT domain-containing protein n=1 Tax=Cotesia glomerata TaxID=32391 RepID=A0AAV7IXH3_COTGL|nr:hypothetical protein KQX54_005116 [Cotesia glomerata]
MSSKVPKLSITMDKILLKEFELKFGVSENSEISAKDIFDNAVKNSDDDVIKSTIVTENRCLSNADKNIIDELNDILSDDVNFFPSEEVKSMPSPNLDNNYENLESFYLDYLERDDSSVDASSSAPSEASNSSLQLQGKQKCSMKEFCSCPLFDTRCSNTFSTQIYTSNEIFENHYINEEFLDEDFFLDIDNNSPKNDTEITSELQVSAVKLSDRAILSYANPGIPKRVENNNNSSVLSKELRVVLKKITEEEINKYINAKNNNSSNKKMEKELKVLLTRITDIKSPKLVEEKKDTLYKIQDSKFYQENNSEDWYFDHSCYELQKTIKMQLKRKNSRYERKRKIEKNFGDTLKNGKVRVYDGNMSDLNDNKIVTHGKEVTSLDEYLIEIAGGIVYKNISKNLKPPAMIVTCSKDEKKVQNLMKKKPNFFERVVTITFITDCIINQEIIPE